ncbi:hypothetical protein BAU15_07535 [Enterococcus sp. JM4C]|uniref:SpaA isopeptide-forming pilin-related protein n=1 Tax=Candidatus Enterococcus huntleyi TaxID=1857217 RepID=UPI00137A6515|nr:SpaA isopeptide-forming pilin-related protein [Enterococcus sp. JM4C]KAF1297554.1 hypothetical protein BAU15_07535 [Enterococcus sp. JM4C]
MHKTQRIKQIVTVLLPVIFLLGVVLAIPRGNVLKADDSEQPFAHVKINGKTVSLADTLIQEETVQLELTGKENYWLRLPDDENYEVYQEKTGEETQTEIITYQELMEVIEQSTKESATSIEDDQSEETIQVEASIEEPAEELSLTSSTSSNNNEVAQQPAKFYQIKEEPHAGTYFQLKKEETTQLHVKRTSKKMGKVIITEVGKEKVQQNLFHFETTESTTAETVEEQSQPSSTSSEPQSEVAKKEEQPSASTQESSIEDKQTKTDVAQSDGVHSVKTETTNKSVDELLNAEYQVDDSLLAPKFIAGKEQSSSKNTQALSSLIVKDVLLSTRTGTAGFDNNDLAGYDSSATNTRVRSFDQISYLVSFSIQNTTLNENYKDIRYRVTGTMPNAVELVSGVPKNNGEISNGKYVSNTNGSQYSEGSMESIISGSGQIFVPIILSVYGAENGKQIQPTIKLEIVDAMNVTTGKKETFNKTYTVKELPKLQTPVTYVSAKPSVGVTMVRGETRPSTTLGIDAKYTMINGYDVGIVTTLKPLTGRATGDYRGSTFPKGAISYTVKQKGTYQKNGTTSAMSASQYEAFDCFGFAPAVKNRSSVTWSKNAGLDVTKYTQPLQVPNANTKKLHLSQPTGDLSLIGVYNSGTFTGGKTTKAGGTTFSNSGYAGVVNPYTYNMTGERAPGATNKSFSSQEVIFAWDGGPSTKIGQANGWNRYDIILYIDSVSYDGLTTSNDTSLSYPTIITSTGAYAGGPLFVKSVDGTPQNVTNLELNLPVPNINGGNGRLNQGDEIYLGAFDLTSNHSIKQFKSLLMWDPTTFKYDTNRKSTSVTSVPESAIESRIFKYGVAKNITQTPPYTMNISTLPKNWDLYSWYSTPEAAQKVGPISAVESILTLKTLGSVNHDVSHYPRLPVIVTGNPGDRNGNGKPITLMESSQFINASGAVLFEPAVNNGKLNTKYLPTVYDSNGNVTSTPDKYWNYYGTSAYIQKFSITTKTEVERSTYQTTDDVNIKITGVPAGTKGVNYDSSLITKLPKGISYKPGSAKDGLGKALPNPTITTNSDGTSTLKWSFSKISLTTGIEVNFSSSINYTNLSFEDTGYTNNLGVKTVGEIWLTGSPTVKDTAPESVRSSSDHFTVQLIQQVTISKTVNKTNIEVGDVDPTLIDNTITYTIKLKNESATPITNLNVLDVLPYNNDARGTKFSGSFAVQSIQTNQHFGTKIYYSNSIENESAIANPNGVIGPNWIAYAGSSINPADPAAKNAKSVRVITNSLGVGQELTLTIKLRASGQKAGDVLVNNASMNSFLNLPVTSETVTTKVYGRDFKGTAWFDDNKDGLMGTNEVRMANVPVKLYRTSIAKPTYANQLVEESLTGERFIDLSGNVTKKTDANGNYTFSNLPEGKYVAEFVIGNRVTAKEFSVTEFRKGGAANDKVNSKANVTTYKTPAYEAPILSSLPAKLTTSDKTFHVVDVHLGVVRLKSQLSITKTVDKAAIEVGSIDPSISGGVNNTLTYKVTVKNTGTAQVPNVVLLDYLPYKGDTRGTTLSGSYTVTDATVSGTNAKITYTNTAATTAANENLNPNTKPAWTAYTPGTTPVANIKGAKAFLVSQPSLAPGASIVLTVKLTPTNQKAGELIKNNASVNDGINNGGNAPLRSNTVVTTVYGRDFKGTAWFDDNKDGLMGTAEVRMANIPVKLYRTSIAKTTYANQLVTQSLTGEKFMDGTTVNKKTDANGNYTFANLPEGNYVAEFVIGDRVTAKEFSVTEFRKGGAANDKVNSKANVTTYKTPAYEAPILSSLPAKLSTSDKTFHVVDVHLGVLRIKSQLSITKTVDKAAIEVGSIDPSITGGINNTLTYKVTVKNTGAARVPNVELLDYLPYKGDTRGTTLSGSYTVTDATVSGTNAKITYSITPANTTANENMNPNTKPAWNPYTPGTTPVANIKGAKAFLVSQPSLDPGASMVLTVKLAPTNQKASELIKNNASVNDGTNGGGNAPLRSNTVVTTVYGRDFKGTAWFDDNKDGLMGTSEVRMANIPVKLYRTSIAKTTYANQLVTQSLTGEKFMDGTTVNKKTDANGNYTFANLPEGNYVAEFVIGDRVTAKEFSVTEFRKGGAANDKVNSKANVTTYKTPAYEAPILSSLPAKLTTSDKTFHVVDVHLGVLRIKSQLSITKTVDKAAIEVGSIDPSITGGINNTLTYKVTVKNTGTARVPNVELLDYLPYKGDTRGTTLSGSYTVTDATVTGTNAKITYTNTAATTTMNENLNPNTKPVWTAYTPGTTPVANIKGAKAFLVSQPSLDPGASMVLTVKLVPTNQKASELIKNNASVNDGTNGGGNAPLRSNTVVTTVYGRDFKGTAWFDDNKDGLMGTAEVRMANIPVKLYRTSIAKTTYANQLVTENLTGTKFIDSSGNSTNKTDANGNYIFTNLPEGNYVAEFVIGDRVTAQEFSVTEFRKGGAANDKVNSKANVTTYKTPAYEAPILSSLPAKLTTSDKTFHVVDVHLGVLRIKSQLSITKTVDKAAIEVGSIDPSITGGIDNTLTYKVTVKNTGTARVPNVELLDYLPYKGDTRGTTLSGAYTVTDATVTGTNAKITYSVLPATATTNENMDPNKKPAWNPHPSGTTPVADIKGAKAFLVSQPSLEPGASMVLTVKLKPTNQKASELIKNNASVNDGTNGGGNAPLRSNTVVTTVYGRDFKGTAWFDDNKDGLMGTNEPRLANIPVKLYRTSLTVATYKKVLVTESLTGEKFMDGTTVKKMTDANGNYIFANLPEGNYVAEFVIGDKVKAMEFGVTEFRKGGATNDKVNSKSSVTAPFESPAYEAPILTSLPAKTSANDKTFHVVDVHLGVVQVKSQLSIKKTVDKAAIEVGSIDPSINDGVDNTLTYKVTVSNEGSARVPNVELLDYLPYKGDTRGTTLSGTYTVTDATVVGTNAKITYTNTAATTAVNETTDPNTKPAWTAYIPGTTPVANIKNAKAFLVSQPSLEPGASIVLTVKLKPTNQKAGELIQNDARVNDGTNNPLKSNIVTTKVYARMLSGVAWFDDNYDGFIGKLNSGKDELKVKDIPVKLYRTSLTLPSYQNELVKQSLTGTAFVDASGNSLIKTDANGKYVFSDLPEGSYIAKFEIDGRVIAKEFKVTTPNAGTEADIYRNSKVNQNTYKTIKSYEQPLLKNLPTLTEKSNGLYHIEHLNLGLIHPWKIRIFKYAAGTAVDGNRDGVLSNVEKSTGLALQGAEFTIYEGNKMDESKKVGTAVTDSTGHIDFEFLFNKDYTLVETKAPVGYELVKEPIAVKVSEGNEVVMVYQEDDKVTVLPFTGGNGPIQLFLMGSGSLMVLGLLGIAWHYRTPRKKGEH